MPFSFTTSMKTVCDVQNNVDKAKELCKVINDKVTNECHGALDYSKSIELCIKDALDVVHGLELLVDRLLSIELK